MLKRIGFRSALLSRSFATSFKPMNLEDKPCKCTPDKPPTDLPKEYGPLATIIHQTLNEHLKPTYLEIKNDSWKHSHHAPMQGAANTTESHFKVIVASEKFNGLNALKRHRLVYGLLQEAGVIGDGSKTDGKIHALQIDAKVP